MYELEIDMFIDTVVRRYRVVYDLPAAKVSEITICTGEQLGQTVDLFLRSVFFFCSVFQAPRDDVR